MTDASLVDVRKPLRLCAHESHDKRQAVNLHWRRSFGPNNMTQTPLKGSSFPYHLWCMYGTFHAGDSTVASSNRIDTELVVVSNSYSSFFPIIDLPLFDYEDAIRIHYIHVHIHHIGGHTVRSYCTPTSNGRPQVIP